MTNVKSLWKNKDFTILWSGQTVSAFGTQIDQLAYPLIILFLTNSPLQSGIVTVFFSIPTFLFGLPAGALVDRWDKKKVLIICDIVRFLATGSIPVIALFGHLNVWLLYTTAFIEGTCGVFFFSAITASLPKIVGKENLIDAYSKNETSGGIASFAGPAIGGFLYQVVGKTIPFLADAISYIVSVISLLFVKTTLQEERGNVSSNLKKEIIEGLVWLWEHPIIRIITLLTAGGALVGSGQNLVIILLAKQLDIGAAAIGIIFSIGAVGSIIGAYAAGQVGKRLKVLQAIIGARWFMALILPLYLIAPNALILGIITALYFVASPLYGVLLAGYRTSLIPDALQGRVASAYRMITIGGYSIGGLIAGFLLEKSGTNVTIIIFSVFLFMLAIFATLFLVEKKVRA